MKFNKVLITDAIRTIERSQSRFLSIIAIVALGNKETGSRKFCCTCKMKVDTHKVWVSTFFIV